MPRNTKKPIVTPAVANATAVASLPKATTPAQAHALETLADFLKSAEYSKDAPVLHVYSQEKGAFLRDYLKVARLRAEAQGKTPLKFVTIKSPTDPKSAGDPKKAVGPKPPAPNLP